MKWNDDGDDDHQDEWIGIEKGWTGLAWLDFKIFETLTNDTWVELIAGLSFKT